jgi:hypothetical protein
MSSVTTNPGTDLDTIVDRSRGSTAPAMPVSIPLGAIHTDHSLRPPSNAANRTAAA